MSTADEWYSYFKQNMDALGMPTPNGVFDGIGSALATITTLEGMVARFGTKVTIAELIGAGFMSDKLAAAGGLSAAFYLGAVIGSSAVATGRVLGDGTSMGIALYDLWIDINHFKKDMLDWNSSSVDNFWPAGFGASYEATFSHVYGSYGGSWSGGTDISSGFGTRGSLDFTPGSDDIYIYNPQIVIDNGGSSMRVRSEVYSEVQEAVTEVTIVGVYDEAPPLLLI